MKTVYKDNGINRVQKNGVFGTHEWANCNANLINGCRHDCKYCYSKEMAIRFKRKTAENWKIETVRENALKKKFNKHSGRIMFPSSHDIHPNHLDEAIEFLSNLLLPGNTVLIVSKPHFVCIQAICRKFARYRDKLVFRFSIGSLDSDVLKFWEPNAPNFEERLASLKYAHENGFQTSVSCEPLLDTKANSLITKLLPYINDSIWIGKANFLIKRMKTNGWGDPSSIKKATELLDKQKDKYFTDLYDHYKDDGRIKWKESIKNILGIKIPDQAGLDI
jgi:uncharacterized Fe-S cluster-containing radical SAM superfamily protein